MKRTQFVRLSVWLLDHTESATKRGRLSGDLLEELEGGCSAGWFYHQVFTAVLINALTTANRCARLVAFAAGWSALYPLWRTACVGGLTYSMDRYRILAWPWSSILPLIYGVLPAVLFVWLGFATYTVLSGSMSWRSARELSFALSTGASMIFAASLVVLRQLRHPQIVLRDLTRTDFFLVDHLYFISLPIALSLLVTLWIGASDTPRVGRLRRKKTSRWGMRLARMAQMFAFLPVLCTCSSAQSSSPVPGLTHGTDEELIQTLRTKLAEDTAAGKFSGAALIAREGTPIFEQAYGFADREQKISNTVETRFRIGSVNKIFTAVATLQLVESGRVKLDDPLVRYLPNYPNKDLARRVTIGELLNHTGGTGDIFGTGPNVLFSEEYKAHRLELRTLDDYIRIFGDRPTRYEPGSRFEYSNYGYILLGKVIEKASGEDYYEYMRNHVYRPAGMKFTGELPEDEKVSGRSVGYTTMDGNKSAHPNTGSLPYRGIPAGGGYSTVGDLLAFAKALQQHKLLNANYTSLMMKGNVAMPHDDHYGYGLMVHSLNGSTCVGHAGGYPGMNADVELCNDGRYVFVVLANVDPPVAQRLGYFIANWVTLSDKR
ncbi:beta-lactamase family protein [Edaphobacter sp. HDX4]|uniref:serine hydrolase domain-containing protein n=1 Tax=Edaphobacter sp. HDX4 TaxID=2794064 RepID=UPI002FE507F8